MVLFFRIVPWKQLKHQGKTLINTDKYKMNFVTNKELPNVLGASSMNTKRGKKDYHIFPFSKMWTFSHTLSSDELCFKHSIFSHLFLHASMQSFFDLETQWKMLHGFMKSWSAFAKFMHALTPM